MYEVAIFKMFAYIEKGHQSYINRGGPVNGLPNPTWSVGKMGHFLESLAVPMESRKDSILSVHFETSA